MQVTDHLIRHVRARAAIGLAKYGVTLDRGDLSLTDWLAHALEEATDLSGYLRRLSVFLEREMQQMPSAELGPQTTVQDLFWFCRYAEREAVDLAVGLQFHLSRLEGSDADHTVLPVPGAPG